MPPLARLLVALSACAAIWGAPATASASAYQQFCKLMAPNNPAAEKYRAAIAPQVAGTAAVLATNDAVARRVRNKLRLAAPPVIVARSAEKIYGKRDDREIALFSDLDRRRPHWWYATLDRAGALVEVRPADAYAKRAIVGYPRGTGAFVVFNDLLGGDQTDSRQGCFGLFDAWFGLEPAVVAKLKQAFTDGRSPPSSSYAAALQRAWLALANARPESTPAGGMNRDTIARIGPKPPFAIVYHDEGLPGDGIGTIDIVRIGATAHTYAIVYLDTKPLTLGSGPYCVVGDERCAAYYVWP